MPLKDDDTGQKGIWANDDGILDLFGGKRQWKESEWMAVDDRVRGGMSRSQLSVVYPTEARFYGQLDIEALGGAGFASQATRRNKVGPWNLKTYDGIAVKIQDCDDMIYTIALKDTTNAYKPPAAASAADNMTSSRRFGTSSISKLPSEEAVKAKSTVSWEVHIRFRTTPRPATPTTATATNANEDSVKSYMLSGAANTYRHSSGHRVPGMKTKEKENESGSSKTEVTTAMLQQAFAQAFGMGPYREYREYREQTTVFDAPSMSGQTSPTMSMSTESIRSGSVDKPTPYGTRSLTLSPPGRNPIPEFSELAIRDDKNNNNKHAPHTPNVGKKMVAGPILSNITFPINNHNEGPSQAQLDKYYSAQYTIPLDDTPSVSEAYFIPFSAFRPYYRGRPIPDYHRPLRRGKIRSISLMVRSHFGKQSGRFSNHIDRIVAYDIDSFRCHERVSEVMRLTKATEALLDYSTWEDAIGGQQQQRDEVKEQVGAGLGHLIDWGDKIVGSGGGGGDKETGSVSSAEDNVVADWNLIDDGEVANAKEMAGILEEKMEEERKRREEACVIM